MQSSKIVEELIIFIRQEFLQDTASDLDQNTPILELGILDSLSMVHFLSFVNEKFGVQIPETKIVPEHFANIATIAKLITSLKSKATVVQQQSDELRKLVRLQESYGVLSATFTPNNDQQLKLHSLKVEGAKPTLGNVTWRQSFNILGTDDALAAW